MKKHIIATLTVLLVFTVLLGGFLIFRSREEKKNAPVRKDFFAEETNTEKSEQKEDIGEEKSEEESSTKRQEESTDTHELTMIFAGDVLFANSFKNCYDAGGMEAVVSGELLEQFTQADIAMVNEEFPFSTRGAPMEDKQYTFRADPVYVSALLEMGVDVVSLANNHILDYGTEALEDTFATLDGAGIAYVGAGATKERARELFRVEHGSRTFGFLSASRVIPVESWNVDNVQPGVFTTYDGTALSNAVAEAKRECDFVTVFVHWGVEHEAYPVDYQRSLARQYIDAGADLVIGAHTHCLQGIEFYNGKPIFYSLGNFIFGSSIEKTAALCVTVSEGGETEYMLIPAKAAGGCTVKTEGSEAEELFRYMEEISQGITVSETGKVLKNADDL